MVAGEDHTQTHCLSVKCFQNSTSTISNIEIIISWLNGYHAGFNKKKNYLLIVRIVQKEITIIIARR